MLEQEEDWYIFVRLLYDHICIVAICDKINKDRLYQV